MVANFQANHNKTTEVSQTPIERVIDAFEAMGSNVTKGTLKEYDGKSVQYYKTHCPGPNHANGDKNPSLDFCEVENQYGETTVYFHCWSAQCTRYDILNALKIDSKTIPGTAIHNYNKQPILSTSEMVNYTQLPWQVLFNLGWSDEAITYHDKDGTPYKVRGVLIPHYNEDGTLYPRHKLRVNLHNDPSNPKNPRFKWTPGDAAVIPYGLNHLSKAVKQGYIVIEEGETDFATLYSYDIPALAISGKGNEKSLDGAMLKGIPRVYVIQEIPKDACKLKNGEEDFPYKIKKRLLETGYTGEVRRVPLRTLTGAKDPSELYKNLIETMQRELPANKKQISRSEHQRRYTEIFQSTLEHSLLMDEDTGMRGQEVNQEEELDTRIIDKAIADKDAKALYRAASELALLTRNEYAVYKVQIKENFTKGTVNFNDLDAAVNQERKKIAENAKDTGESEDVTAIGEIFYNRFGDTWAYDAKVEQWYQWVGTHWNRLEGAKDEKLSLDRFFRDLLREHGYKINSVGMLDCVHRSAQLTCKRKLEPIADVVNFKNGTLHIKTMQLTEHQKDDNLMYCLPYDYNNIGSHNVITNWLISTLHSQQPDGGYTPDPFAVQIYMAHLGLALIRDTRLQYALFIKGVPGAGKSTLLDLINLLCGVIDKPGVTKYAPHDIFSDELEGKRSRFTWHRERVVCVDELPVDGLKDEQAYKRMTAHGGVSMRGIARDELQENQWIPKVVVTCNEAPSFKDTTGAIKRRNIYITAPIAIPEDARDVELIDKMVKELGSFAHTCIQLAVAVKKLGYYPQSVAMRTYAAAVSANGNPLKLFLEERCVLGNNSTGKELFVPSGALYSAYRGYCDENGYKYPLAMNSFITALLDMSKGITSPKNAKKMPGYDKQARFLFGVAIAVDGYLIPDDDEPTVDRLLTRVDRLLTDFVKACQPLQSSSTGAFSTPQNCQVDRLYTLSEKDSILKEPPFLYEENEQGNKVVGVYSGGLEGEKCVKPVNNYENGHVNPPVEPTHKLTGFLEVCQPSVNDLSYAISDDGSVEGLL